MAKTVARLKGGELSLTGKVNERYPKIDGPMKIRYIRDKTNGSNQNTNKHIVEIQAIDIKGNLVSAGKKAYDVASGTSLGTIPTDGVIESAKYVGYGDQGFVLDLEDHYELSKITVWHYYGDSRVYKDVTLEVSTDGVKYFKIFDSAESGTYAETKEGKMHYVPSFGLVAHYPFDDTLEAKKTVSGCKVLCGFINSNSRSWYNWFRLNAASSTHIEATALSALTVEEAMKYDLIVFDSAAFAVEVALLEKLKAFTDAGVSCIARGNDTRTNSMASSRLVSSTEAIEMTATIQNNLPFAYNGPKTFERSPDECFMATSVSKDCTVLYQRTPDLITGYIYHSPVSGAVLYFDGEGESSISKPTVYPINVAAFEYAILKSKGNPPTIANTIVREDGLHIDRYRTNLNTTSQAYGKYNNLQAPMTITKLEDKYNGCDIYRWSMTPTTEAQLNSLKGNYGNQGVTSSRITYAANTPYVSSIIWRPVNRADVKIGGIASNIQGWSDSRGFKDLGDGWFKTEVYRDGTVTTEKSDPSFLSVVCPSSVLNQPTTIDLCCFQVQEGLYPTAYTPNTNQSSQFTIPFNLKPPYTINVFHKPNSLLSMVKDQPSSPKILQLGNYYNNASISYWNYSAVLKAYIKADTGDGWNKDVVFKTLTATEWDGKEHMYTIVALDTKNFEFYMDGVKLGSTVTTTIDTTNITNLIFAADNNNSAVYRDLSIYNVALSASQVKAMYNSPLSINGDGDFHTDELIETPINIPKGALYFPLDCESSDSKKLVNSVKSSETYVDSALWAGRGTTNSYTKGNFNSASPDDGWAHWGSTGHKGTYGQNTDPEFIYTTGQTYSHWVKNDAGATADYLVYQSPDFAGGYRSLQVIMSMSDGSPVTQSKTYPAWNAGNGGATSGYWTEIKQIGNSKWYLCKAEGFSQDGSNDLVGVYVKAGYQIYFDTMFLEASMKCTPITLTTRPATNLKYHLHRDYNLDWSKDWTIVYWRKPIITNTGDLAGHNMDSLGTNANTVGAGFTWTGKDKTGNSNVRPAYTIDPAKFFNQWQMMAIRYTGGKIRFINYTQQGRFAEDLALTIPTANYFATQHGFDLCLGGWFDGSPAELYNGAYYKDLIVSRTALTDTELDNIYKTNISLIGTKMLIQNQIKEI